METWFLAFLGFGVLWSLHDFVVIVLEFILDCVGFLILILGFWVVRSGCGVYGFSLLCAFRLGLLVLLFRLCLRCVGFGLGVLRMSCLSVFDWIYCFVRL